MLTLPACSRKVFRHLYIDLILATDLGQHFDILGKFKSKIENQDLVSAPRENKTLILQVAIKCADGSNPAKPFSVYERWTERIVDEFYIQGDEERRRKMPVSPFMDRANPNIAKSQMGFIDFVVSPIYEAWCVFCNTDLYTNHLKENRAFYASKVDKPAEGATGPTGPTSPPPPSSGQSSHRAQGPSGRHRTRSSGADSAKSGRSARSARSTRSARSGKSRSHKTLNVPQQPQSVVDE